MTRPNTSSTPSTRAERGVARTDLVIVAVFMAATVAVVADRYDLGAILESMGRALDGSTPDRSG